jgi:hypothetical protein
MGLPYRHEAHIDRRKLTEYLLNRNHPDAKGKSAFFLPGDMVPTGNSFAMTLWSMLTAPLSEQRKPGTARRTL